jgi:hypothetical protein
VTDSDYIDLVSAVLTDRWQVSAETAEGLARFSLELARIYADDRLADFLARASRTKAGTALAIALGSGEPVREAARRLRVSHGALVELVAEYRRALGERETGPDTVEAE